MRKLYQKAKEFYSLRLIKESLELNNDNKILARDDFIKSLEYFKQKKTMMINGYFQCIHKFNYILIKYYFLTIFN